MPILQACFNQEQHLRPTCAQLLQSVAQIRNELNRKVQPDTTRN
jgi:hypothetical protein